MTLHELKCWPEYLALIASGAKTFEVRECRDRTFREGDSLILRGYDPGTGYTGQVVRATIGYVLPAGAWGLPTWTTVFSLLNVEAGMLALAEALESAADLPKSANRARVVA